MKVYCVFYDTDCAFGAGPLNLDRIFLWWGDAMDYYREKCAEKPRLKTWNVTEWDVDEQYPPSIRTLI